MSAPQRYADGVTNIAKGKTLSEMPMPDPTVTHGYFNDFFQYSTADWITSTSGTGTLAVSDTVAGGALVITPGAATEGKFDSIQLSKDGGTNDSEVFLFATGKKAWFKTRIYGADVSDMELDIGLCLVNTDLRNAAPADGVWFTSDDGTTDIDLIIAKNSSQVKVSGIGTWADTTWISLGYYWDGVDAIHYFVDDVKKGEVYVGTSLPDDEYLTVTISNETGEATANALSIDYIGAWMER